MHPQDPQLAEAARQLEGELSAFEPALDARQYVLIDERANAIADLALGIGERTIGPQEVQRIDGGHLGSLMAFAIRPFAG